MTPFPPSIGKVLPVLPAALIGRRAASGLSIFKVTCGLQNEAKARTGDFTRGLIFNFTESNRVGRFLTFPGRTWDDEKWKEDRRSSRRIKSWHGKDGTRGVFWDYGMGRGVLLDAGGGGWKAAHGGDPRIGFLVRTLRLVTQTFRLSKVLDWQTVLTWMKNPQNCTEPGSHRRVRSLTLLPLSFSLLRLLELQSFSFFLMGLHFT